MGSRDRERENSVLPFDQAAIIPIPRPGRLEAAADALAAALVALGIEPPAELAKPEGQPVRPSRPSITITRRTDRPSDEDIAA